MNYRALDQWTREIPIVAQRGKITDRNGVVLADNSTAYTVFARSNAVKDVEMLYGKCFVLKVVKL